MTLTAEPARMITTTVTAVAHPPTVLLLAFRSSTGLMICGISQMTGNRQQVLDIGFIVQAIVRELEGSYRKAPSIRPQSQTR